MSLVGRAKEHPRAAIAIAVALVLAIAGVAGVAVMASRGGSDAGGSDAASAGSQTGATGGQGGDQQSQGGTQATTSVSEEDVDAAGDEDDDGDVEEYVLPEGFEDLVGDEPSEGNGVYADQWGTSSDGQETEALERDTSYEDHVSQVLADYDTDAMAERAMQVAGHLYSYEGEELTGGSWRSWFEGNVDYDGMILDGADDNVLYGRYSNPDWATLYGQYYDFRSSVTEGPSWLEATSVWSDAYSMEVPAIRVTLTADEPAGEPWQSEWRRHDLVSHMLLVEFSPSSRLPYAVRDVGSTILQYSTNGIDTNTGFDASSAAGIEVGTVW